MVGMDGLPQTMPFKPSYSQRLAYLSMRHVLFTYNCGPTDNASLWSFLAIILGPKE